MRYSINKSISTWKTHTQICGIDAMTHDRLQDTNAKNGKPNRANGRMCHGKKREKRSRCALPVSCASPSPQQQEQQHSTSATRMSSRTLLKLPKASRFAFTSILPKSQNRPRRPSLARSLHVRRGSSAKAGVPEDQHASRIRTTWRGPTCWLAHPALVFFCGCRLGAVHRLDLL